MPSRLNFNSLFVRSVLHNENNCLSFAVSPEILSFLEKLHSVAEGRKEDDENDEWTSLRDFLKLLKERAGVHLKEKVLRGVQKPSSDQLQVSCYTDQSLFKL